MARATYIQHATGQEPLVEHFIGIQGAQLVAHLIQIAFSNASLQYHHKRRHTTNGRRVSNGLTIDRNFTDNWKISILVYADSDIESGLKSTKQQKCNNFMAGHRVLMTGNGKRPKNVSDSLNTQYSIVANLATF